MASSSLVTLAGGMIDRNPCNNALTNSCNNALRVVWRHVVWGVTLQFLFGLLILRWVGSKVLGFQVKLFDLRWPVGKAAFGCLGKKVSIFLDYTDVGSSFVFGYLVDQVRIEI